PSETHPLSLHDALPISLGTALALVASVALSRHRYGVFGAATILTLAASPLAFLYLALPLSALLVAHRAEWRSFRRPLEIVVQGRSEEHTSELQSPCNLV